MKFDRLVNKTIADKQEVVVMRLAKLFTIAVASLLVLVPVKADAKTLTFDEAAKKIEKTIEKVAKTNKDQVISFEMKKASKAELKKVNSKCKEEKAEVYAATPKIQSSVLTKYTMTKMNTMDNGYYLYGGAYFLDWADPMSYYKSIAGLKKVYKDLGMDMAYAYTEKGNKIKYTLLVKKNAIFGYNQVKYGTKVAKKLIKETKGMNQKDMAWAVAEYIADRIPYTNDPKVTPAVSWKAIWKGTAYGVCHVLPICYLNLALTVGVKNVGIAHGDNSAMNYIVVNGTKFFLDIQCVKDRDEWYDMLTETKDTFKPDSMLTSWEEYQEYVDERIRDCLTEKEFNSLRNPDPRKVSRSEYWLLTGKDWKLFSDEGNPEKNKCCDTCTSLNYKFAHENYKKYKDQLYKPVQNNSNAEANNDNNSNENNSSLNENSENNSNENSEEEEDGVPMKVEIDEYGNETLVPDTDGDDFVLHHNYRDESLYE